MHFGQKVSVYNPNNFGYAGKRIVCTYICKNLHHGGVFVLYKSKIADVVLMCDDNIQHTYLRAIGSTQLIAILAEYLTDIMGHRHVHVDTQDNTVHFSDYKHDPFTFPTTQLII
jgi:hypothetical protein